jgi:hypothetical protein
MPAPSVYRPRCRYGLSEIVNSVAIDALPATRNARIRDPDGSTTTPAARLRASDSSPRAICALRKSRRLNRPDRR